MTLIGGLHQRGPALFIRIIDGLAALKQTLQVLKMAVGGSAQHRGQILFIHVIALSFRSIHPIFVLDARSPTQVFYQLLYLLAFAFHALRRTPFRILLGVFSHNLEILLCRICRNFDLLVIPIRN